MFALAVAACFAVVSVAKDIKTVVLNTNPQMHCENCENKIKNNLRFEKGIKEITTDLNTKTVTIKYDADKTNVDNIIKGFAKINYTATVAGGCCGTDSCKCGSAATKSPSSCCGSKKGE